jgi:hypothetical protein
VTMEPLDPGCCSPGSPVMVVWEPGGYLLTVGAVSLPLRLRKGRWWVLPPGASYRSRGTGPFTTLASATRAGRNLLVYGLATQHAPGDRWDFERAVIVGGPRNARGEVSDGGG